MSLLHASSGSSNSMLAKLQANDAGEQAEFWRAHRPAVLAIARNILGRSSEAEDLADEVPSPDQQEAIELRLLLPRLDDCLASLTPKARQAFTLRYRGGLMEEGSGCEWFVGIFSQAPLKLDDLSIGVANARPRQGIDCGLDADIPEAVAIRIFPVRMSSLE